MVSNTPPEDLVGSYFVDNYHSNPKLKAEQHPRVIIVAGISGSGKSTYIDNQISNAAFDGFCIIQPDNFRKLHPDIDLLINKHGYENAHKYTGHFSSKFASMLLDKALTNQYNVVYETTFANLNTAQELLNKFQSAGYIINILTFPVDVQTSVERNKERYEFKKDISNTLPRIVLPEVIESMAKRYEETLLVITQNKHIYKIASIEEVSQTPPEPEMVM